MIDERRIRRLNENEVGHGDVVYWMSRDQRTADNRALLYAQAEALSRKVALIVVFSLCAVPGRTNVRQYDFMVKGLREVEVSLRNKHIPFILLEGQAEQTVAEFMLKGRLGELVMDFSPLRDPRKTRAILAKKIPCRVTEVDAHNVVPCWIASDKKEYAAYTFRPKIHRKWSEFAGNIPKLQTHPYQYTETLQTENNWDVAVSKLALDESVGIVASIVPGEKAAHKQLTDFIDTRLSSYAVDRNDPNKFALSILSPYLHFGQLAAERVIEEVHKSKGIPKDTRDAFIEEIFVRKELADNFCLYEKKYDKVAGAHQWAQKTISEHKNDAREYLYSAKQFEAGETHDALWNAMQIQMVKEGKMHGWCRMYWAKKIFEWTPDAQTAIDIALYLNDKYELDGYDPNGVTGVMWSICGVHDRAWNERQIFGKIRYMNYAGAKRKFDIKAYIKKYGGAEKNLFN